MKIIMKPSDIDMYMFRCCNLNSRVLFRSNAIVDTIEDLIEMCKRSNNKWINFTEPIFSDVIDSNWEFNLIISLKDQGYLHIKGTDNDFYYIYEFTPQWFKMLIPYWNIIEGGYTKSAYFG